MHDLDVALVSCRQLPEPDPDAAPLAAGLAATGISSSVLAWDDPGADWSRAPLTVLRSCWNYPRHHDAFLRWAERAAAASELWNPLPIVRWNSHKSYLLDLERRGILITPTSLLPRGSDLNLRTVMADRRWDEVVVKPAVSAASYKTIRAGRGSLDTGEAHLRDLLSDRDVLVQQYLPSVEGHGERALIWIDGELTHAVRKTPRFAGDDEAASATAVPISSTEADLARRAVAAVDGPLVYARADVAPGPAGAPVLMELELIEPSLFFAQHRPALDRFVAAIRRLVDSR